MNLIQANTCPDKMEAEIENLNQQLSEADTNKIAEIAPKTPVALVVHAAQLWNLGDVTMIDVGRKLGVKNPRSAQHLLYVADKAGLLTRRLPGKDYRANRAKYNPNNRERLNSVGAFSKDVLTVLDKRERHIFSARRMKKVPITLKRLGEIHGISLERVRQIENLALAKVQTVQTVKEGSDGNQ